MNNKYAVYILNYEDHENTHNANMKESVNCIIFIYRYTIIHHVLKKSDRYEIIFSFYIDRKTITSLD